MRKSSKEGKRAWSYWSATVRDVMDGMRVQRGRIGLSFLAVVVGIMAMTVLVAVLGGLQMHARKLIEDFGVNVFAIRRNAQESKTEPGASLRLTHAAMLMANLDGCLFAPVQHDTARIGGTETTVDVITSVPQLLNIKGWRIRSGRFLDEADLLYRERYAVITRALADKYGWHVDSTIELRDTPFVVVGVLDSDDTMRGESGSSVDDAFGTYRVIVPISLPAFWLEGRRIPEDRLDTIYILTKDAHTYEKRLAEARRLLAQPDQHVDDLSWITPETLLARIRRLQRTIKWTVGSVALLCLALGGTTLMSLMVANVRDRVQEIGLRRALGAEPIDIALLFLVEALMITVVAGGMGAMIAHAFLFATQSRFPVPLRLGWLSMLIPLVTAVILGMGFSYWPARMASRIAPSEALRND